MNYIQKSIHIVTQAKGGVGKSTISAFLYQFLEEHGQVVGFDTDPLSNSFISVKGLDVIKIEADANSVGTRYYDPMVESIIDNQDVSFVIDNGSSTHITLLQYMQDSDIVNLLLENKRPVVMHIPLPGGREFTDCYAELTRLVALFPKVKFVVWENSFINQVELDYQQEASFHGIKPSVLGIVQLRHVQHTPLFEDINILSKLNLSFHSVEEDKDKLFSFAAKRRLKLYKEELFEQLQGILGS